MRQEAFIRSSVVHEGANESWTVDREGDHWYDAACDYAVERLGQGRILVIGSPLFECVELGAKGDVTYLDIRKPPILMNWVYGDAREIPLESESFDSVSSTCVVCHVGLGRYGDELDEGGDVKMLAEVARVLKPGGCAAICFGPCSLTLPDGNVARLGTSHRIYSPSAAVNMANAVGLKVLDLSIWDVVNKRWDRTPNILDSSYLMTYLSKG